MTPVLGMPACWPTPILFSLSMTMRRSMAGTNGTPLQTDLIGMFYNKTLLDQEGLTAPETLDELVTFCGQATEKGYIPIAFGDNEGWEAFHQFSMTANQMD